MINKLHQIPSRFSLARHSTSIQRRALLKLRDGTEATGEPGGHPPLHATAAGTVTLAWLPEHGLGRLREPVRRASSR